MHATSCLLTSKEALDLLGLLKQVQDTITAARVGLLLTQHVQVQRHIVDGLLPEALASATAKALADTESENNADTSSCYHLLSMVSVARVVDDS